MSHLVATYALYLGISVALTVWVGRTLHKNGRIFLVDAFAGNEDLADSVNHLLVVGFYLVNVGCVALAIKLGMAGAGIAGVFESVSMKVGGVLLVLGAMHFTNLYVFARIRRRAQLRYEPPPVAPMGHMQWPVPPAPQAQ
jgi:hypothetical protein